MFSSHTTYKIPKNNEITCASPEGYHYILANCRTVSKPLSDGKPTMPLRPNSSLSRAQEYIDLYCKTGDIKVKADEITNEIDDTIETILSTATQKKVLCQPINHLMNMLVILTFGGKS
jgi:hypothetical protein